MTDELDIFTQSGVIPYRWQGGELQVLLITSRKGRRWIIPKGIVEPDMTPAESAAKEAFEEAGIKGEVNPESVGTYSYYKWGGTCRVTLFLMHVTQEFDEWPESFRKRQWLPPAEAARQVSVDLLQLMLKRLASLIPSQT